MGLASSAMPVHHRTRFALAIARPAAQQFRGKLGILKGISVLGTPEAARDNTSSDAPVVIKKYANRRLYNTSTSSYVTLDDLSDMVKKGTDFSVYDAKTGEDITRSVLTQIIFDEENKGQNLLPIRFLRQLIRFYGDSMQAFIPSYLEFSLESLTREQERFRQQMMESFGGEPFRAMEEQARRNVAMFQQAVQMFNPFAVPQSTNPADPGAPTAAATPGQAEPAASAQDDIRALKEELKAVQRQLEQLAATRKG
jgi:polyhydroxyalkanoate synthesis repressor PhaR